jgi:NAD(P)-dependent dehydrogenase (short-subunit alcohol dehydrogenase family)
VKDLTGKVALITGAAGGIGLGIARAFTEVGVKVALADIDEDILEKSAAELAESGAEVVSVRLDVTDRAAWVAAAERVRAALGPVRLLVNNAGVGRHGAQRGRQATHPRPWRASACPPGFPRWQRTSAPRTTWRSASSWPGTGTT